MLGTIARQLAYETRRVIAICLFHEGLELCVTYCKVVRRISICLILCQVATGFVVHTGVAHELKLEEFKESCLDLRWLEMGDALNSSNCAAAVAGKGAEDDL